jgi:ribosomal-protein-alanine N-acetyltransferase
MSEPPKGNAVNKKNPAIWLLPIDSEPGATLKDDPRSVESTHDIVMGESANLIQSVVEQILAMPSATVPPWGGYLAVDRESSMVIGTCAFKDVPTPDGTVEIAYFTFPGFERLGYASAMARELITLAWRAPTVRRVIAHTLSEPNASTRVLQKVGMRFVGEVFDPEDGRVWQWELTRPM